MAGTFAGRNPVFSISICDKQIPNSPHVSYLILYHNKVDMSYYILRCNLDSKSRYLWYVIIYL